MGAAVAIQNATTKVGSIVSEHGDTVDRAGKMVKMADVSRKAANSDSSKDSVNTGLDALSLVVAGAGTIPIVNLGTVPIQAVLGVAKTANNALHGDMQAAKLAAIEGMVTTGASALPGGGMAVKVGKGALIVGGEVTKHIVASNDGQYNVATLSPAKTPQAQPDANKIRIPD